MNTKAEFHQPSIVRVTNTLGNNNEEQTGPREWLAEGHRGRQGGGSESRVYGQCLTPYLSFIMNLGIMNIKVWFKVKYCVSLINRPGVAGAVLQSPL